MNKYRHPKSSLFLMEIMLNILFFAVLVTICLQLFFKAHNLSENTSALHRAITACTSIAEVYQSNPDGEEVVLTVYPDAIALNKTLLIYFDAEYKPCNAAASSYRAVLEHDDTLHTAIISFYSQEDDEAIYSLSVSSYSPQTLYELTGGNAQ
ncbi:MAG: hypothetical protein IJZ23_08160 [Roseburia sp.]|nr:hypothetical protein [Roseburia sp.]